VGREHFGFYRQIWTKIKFSGQCIGYLRIKHFIGLANILNILLGIKTGSQI
jgi:hypothetical protein